MVADVLNDDSTKRSKLRLLHAGPCVASSSRILFSELRAKGEEGAAESRAGRSWGNEAEKAERGIDAETVAQPMSKRVTFARRDVRDLRTGDETRAERSGICSSATSVPRSSLRDASLIAEAGGERGGVWGGATVGASEGVVTIIWPFTSESLRTRRMIEDDTSPRGFQNFCTVAIMNRTHARRSALAFSIGLACEKVPVKSWRRARKYTFTSL